MHGALQYRASRSDGPDLNIKVSVTSGNMSSAKKERRYSIVLYYY